MSEALVSIIIPCYNSASYVSRAIESALKQTYNNIELILVDNNSTDNTRHILNTYRDQLPHKVFVFHESKPGAPAARNMGLNKARGSWLQFLDSDDELLPKKIEKQIQARLKSNANVVIGNYLLYGNKSKKKVCAIKDPWEGLIRSRLGITSANLWRKKNLELVKGWDETATSSQEYDLMFRLLVAGNQLCFDGSFNTVIHTRRESVGKTDDREKKKSILVNQIMLRLKIHEHLKAQRLLTKRTEKAATEYVYNHIIMNKFDYPELYEEFHHKTPQKPSLFFSLKRLVKLKINKLYKQ